VFLVISVILARYPWIKSINVDNLSVDKKLWTLEGSISINPLECPEDLQFNTDQEGFLPWWENNIQKVLDENGYGFIRIKSITLEFSEISENSCTIQFKTTFRIQE